MSKTSQSQLSPEVMVLENLLLSARQSAPELWDSVAAAINATDAALITSVTASEFQPMRIISAGETTASSRMEGYHG
jgi:hypothetical protein